jgi:rhomboid family GlyGly-CTERM serine protease
MTTNTPEKPETSTAPPSPKSSVDWMFNRQGATIASFMLLTLAGSLLAPILNPWMSYDRAALGNFELWRFLSGNFAHLGLNHALLNLGTMSLAVVLFRGYKSLAWWLAVFIGCCLSVSTGLYVFEPNVSNYVGLSGALYGVLGCGLIMICHRESYNRWLYGIFYIYIVYKVVSQQFDSFDPGYLSQYIDGNVIAGSHLYGLCFGTAAALFDWFRSRSKPVPTK